MDCPHIDCYYHRDADCLVPTGLCSNDVLFPNPIFSVTCLPVRKTSRSYGYKWLVEVTRYNGEAVEHLVGAKSHERLMWVTQYQVEGRFYPLDNGWKFEPSYNDDCYRVTV
jgi:hypothetical protein